ncbi:unnamed protein product [Ectocarpus sp. 12 AP-2014]
MLLDLHCNLHRCLCQARRSKDTNDGQPRCRNINLFSDHGKVSVDNAPARMTFDDTARVDHLFPCKPQCLRHLDRTRIRITVGYFHEDDRTSSQCNVSTPESLLVLAQFQTIDETMGGWDYRICLCFPGRFAFPSSVQCCL